MKFNASRGGHAPGHLREVFLKCVDSVVDKPWYKALGDEQMEFYDPKTQAMWDGMDPKQRALWLTGQLWNCSDTLPSVACQALEIPRGSTYAMAVRKLRAEIV